MDADVAVIGVGSVGSMACWQLSRRGLRVLGFEQFAPGHDRGAAGGETRIFRTAYLEGPQYVPLLRNACQQWRELEVASGRSLLNLNGGLMIARWDTPFIRNVLECIEIYGLEHEILDPTDAARRWPQHRYNPDDTVVLDHQAGFLRPELAVWTAARTAEAQGAQILRHCRVEVVNPDAGGVTVRAGAATYRVARAVIATGPWANRLLPTAAAETRRLVMTWFLTENPSLFAASRFPIFVREENDVHISGVPSVDGVSVKVALNDAYGTVSDPDRLDRDTTREELDRISTVVARWLPGLCPEPCRVSVYQDGYTSDGHAVVGMMPGLPNVIVAYGFSGHGFKMAPAIGAVVADLVIDGNTKIPVDHLMPTRFSDKWSRMENGC